MIVLMDNDLKELYEKGTSKKYKEVERNNELMTGFLRAVKIMTEANTINDIKCYSYLHYEQLKHQLSGYSSVRLSNRFVHRLLFTENDNGIEIKLIEIDNTHYGNK